MKILLVILRAQSTRGGAELYTVTLFHKLVEAGHHVSIAAAAFEDSIPDASRVPLRHSGFGRYRKYNRFIDSLTKHLRSVPYDVVHAMLPAPCNVYHPHAGLELANYQRASFWRRQFNERQWAFTRIEKSLMTGKRPPVTLCLSERAREEASALYPSARERMVTLYSGVDDRRFTPARSSHPAVAAKLPQPAHSAQSIAHSDRGAPACLFIGQDFERKGLDIAIRAVAAHPSATLDVIGGDDARPYHALAQELKLAERVQFLGPTREVAHHLQKADLLLLPARREPFGMVAVEAMLCGVPPIVSSACGVSEIIHDDADGKIVHSDSAEDWARAINQVLAEREARSAACLGRRAELSYANHLKTLTGIYERVAAE